VAGVYLLLTLFGPHTTPDPYAAAIAKYAAGDAEAACNALAGIPQAHVERAIETYLAAFQSTGGVGAGRQLEAIAMLHTDCPLVVAAEPRVALFDVEMAHQALATARGALTHDWPDTNEPDTRRAREFLPHWYALATSVLLGHNGAQEATRLIDEGVKLFPEDQTLRYWRGLVMEFTTVWVGSSLTGPTDAQRPSAPGSTATTGSGPPAAFLWSQTEEAFRHVVQKDPGRLEAHLHHGYALYSLLKYDEAKAEYELARDRSTDAFVVYVADLLLGRLEEDRHDLNAAARDYEHALAKMPRAQDAYIGLASVAARLGDAQRAQELTTRLTSIPEAQRALDPWWAFHTTRVPDDDLQWLRAAVRR